MTAGINVVTDGAGEPALLLTPGMAGAAYDWIPIVEQLAPRHRLLRVERPGLGAGAPRSGLPSLRTEADRLAQVAEKESGVIVVAHSVAGLHAEAMIRLHPELVRGLVLLDPSCSRPRTALPAWWLSGAERAGRRLARGAQLLGLTAPVGPVLWSAAARGQTSRPIPEQVRARGRATFRSAAALTATWQENLAYQTMINDLAALRETSAFPAIPVRVLTATRGMPTRLARRWERCHHDIAETMNARHEIVTDARHHLVWERPGKVLETIATVTGDHE